MATLKRIESRGGKLFAFVAALFSMGFLVTAVQADICCFDPVIQNCVKKFDPCSILKDIYEELVDFGSDFKDDILKREFHIELDGIEENKEEHVLILGHRCGDEEKIILQVTYFAPKTSRSIIQYSKVMKKIECSLKEDRLEIKECDYPEQEMQDLLPHILEGIKEEKKLMKLLEEKS